METLLLLPHDLQEIVLTFYEELYTFNNVMKECEEQYNLHVRWCPRTHNSEWSFLQLEILRKLKVLQYMKWTPPPKHPYTDFKRCQLVELKKDHPWDMTRQCQRIRSIQALFFIYRKLKKDIKARCYLTLVMPNSHKSDTFHFWIHTRTMTHKDLEEYFKYKDFILF